MPDRTAPIPGEIHLQPCNAILSVTTVEFARLDSIGCLLVGEGPYLRVFDCNGRSHLQSIRIFIAQPIHGIVCGEEEELVDGDLKSFRCLIWGGRYVRLALLTVRLTAFVGLRILTRETLSPDWILDARFYPTGACKPEMRHNPATAVLLTSHNTLFSFSTERVFENDPLLQIHLTPIGDGPSSVLYCAHLIWHKSDALLIAAGTIFGEVHLWTCHVDQAQPGTPGVCNVLYFFSGHEGSVFGVRIQEKEFVDDCSQSRRVLASCSDDRTIRIWDISDVDHPRSDPKPESTPRVAKSMQPGFEYSNRQSSIGADGAVVSVMGHLSRIWGIRFVYGSVGCQKLLSFGEDGTVCIWNWREPDVHPKTLHPRRELDLQQTLGHHTGKNIWSVAASDSANGSFLMLSGGADGRVILSMLSVEKAYDNRPQGAQLTSRPSSIVFPVYSAPSGNLDLNILAQDPICSPIEELFAAMQGSWNIHRLLNSKIRSYPSGIFMGTAVLTPRRPTDALYDAESLYFENGQFKTSQGYNLTGSRRYVYRYQKLSNSLTAWFVKSDEITVDYLFHKVDFHDTASKHTSCYVASGDHLCIEDNYNAKYILEYENKDLKRWSLRYDVLGPSKDYFADATFTRLPQDKPCPPGQDLVLGGITSSTPEKNYVITPDVIKSYSWLNKDNIVATTEHGHVLVGKLKAGIAAENLDMPLLDALVISWTHVQQIANLKSHAITASIRNQVVFLSGTNGTVYCYWQAADSISSLVTLPRKLSYLFAQAIPLLSGALGFTIGIIAACIGSRVAYSILTTLPGESDSSSEVFEIGLPPTFVVTSACFMSCEGVLILGSRNGAVCFYNLLQFSKGSAGRASSTILGVHGKESVSVLSSLPQNGGDPSLCYILTAGRDGKVAIHKIHISRVTFEMKVAFETVHALELPLGSNIEGCIFDATTQDLLLWGFRSKDFVVWNETHKKEVMKIECGGSHRSWAYLPSDNGRDGSTFIWTKATKINIYTQPEAGHHVLQLGGHGREIKAIAASVPTIGIDQSSVRLIATGAEDTTIRIVVSPEAEADSSGDSMCLAVMSKHTTGIQQLKWSFDGRFLFSAGGRDEFFAWRIQPVPGIGFGVVCLARCPAITETLELRVMDFHALAVEARHESEMRDCFVISVVYSNSSVRVWLYGASHEAESFKVLHTGTYTTSCLTLATHITLKSELYLLTASTDGHIAFWPLAYALATKGIKSNGNQLTANRIESASEATPIRWSCRHRLHQSSIKCLASVPLPNDALLVATGGDDNSIAFTLITANSQTSDLPTCSTLVIPKAHAAAVTAIEHMPGVQSPSLLKSGRQRLIFVTVGTDQIIKTWILEVDITMPGTGGMRVERGPRRRCSVADVSCMQVAARREGAEAKITVAGIGLETFDFRILT